MFCAVPVCVGMLQTSAAGLCAVLEDAGLHIFLRCGVGLRPGFWIYFLHLRVVCMMIKQGSAAALFEWWTAAATLAAVLITETSSALRKKQLTNGLSTRRRRAAAEAAR